MTQSGRVYEEFAMNIKCRGESEIESYEEMIKKLPIADTAKVLVHALCVLNDNQKRGIIFALSYAIDTYKHDLSVSKEV